MRSKYLTVLTSALWMVPMTVISAQAQTPLHYVTITPCRVVVTVYPNGPLGGPYLAANSSRSFPLLSGSCGIPANVAAYSLNFTALPRGYLSYISAWPTGQTMPNVSTLNAASGLPTANAAIVPAGTNGSINVFASNDTDLLIDINGYFIPDTNAGTQSTAVGTGASNAGSLNTAIGFNSLQLNSGIANTATGALALSSNTSGGSNVAVGESALQFNTSGAANTATGTQALLNDLIGSDNTAMGFNALWSNTTGSDNTAVGETALFSTAIGSGNVAVGGGALYLATGSSNIALGFQAGNQIGGGNNNIDLGNPGQSGDNYVTRIGTGNAQASAFIAGIINSTVSGSAVFVNSNGQLGITPSARRFKEQIRDIGTASSAIMQLHPVSFIYKDALNDGTEPKQYGLIGEEVEKVYPELVVYGQDRQVESVQYHELPVLLLNELQKQHRIIEKQQREIDSEEALVRSLEARLAALEKSISR